MHILKYACKKVIKKRPPEFLILDKNCKAIIMIMDQSQNVDLNKPLERALKSYWLH